MTPFISIIIPVYKVEPYLRECLDSVLAWRFADWEAILVDDGSPDGCGAICDEYAARDPRFRAVHKANEGVAAARNTGLDMAKGEWCWFVDSDDVIDPDTPVLSDLLRDKDLVMFGIKNYNDGDAIPRVEESIKWNEYDDADTFFRRHVSYLHPTMWYHRRFWASDSHAIRFTKGIRLGEDLEFMRKCELLAQHPVRVHHTCYYYRHREGSAYHSSDVHRQVVTDTMKVLSNLLSFITDNGITMRPGLLQRFTNLASSVPAHALQCGMWCGELQREFRKLVADYCRNGVNLTSARFVWIATKVPCLLRLAVRLHRNIIPGNR